LALLKLQTLPSWSFINQPTPSFGVCLSTSGLSLLGIDGVWPPFESDWWLIDLLHVLALAGEHHFP